MSAVLRYVALYAARKTWAALDPSYRGSESPFSHLLRRQQRVGADSDTGRLYTPLCSRRPDRSTARIAPGGSVPDRFVPIRFPTTLFRTFNCFVSQRVDQCVAPLCGGFLLQFNIHASICGVRSLGFELWWRPYNLTSRFRLHACFPLRYGRETLIHRRGHLRVRGTSARGAQRVPAALGRRDTRSIAHTFRVLRARRASTLIVSLADEIRHSTTSWLLYRLLDSVPIQGRRGDVSEPDEDFAAMFEASLKAKRFEKGQTIEGTIVAIGPEVAFVERRRQGRSDDRNRRTEGRRRRSRSRRRRPHSGRWWCRPRAG